jgi:hypothetical protein
MAERRFDFEERQSSDVGHHVRPKTLAEIFLEGFALVADD